MDSCVHMYEVPNHRAQNNSRIHQEGSATLESIHDYTIIPPGTLRKPSNEYQIPCTNPSPCKRRQQRQSNDGSSICGEAKTKKGLKWCLVILSLLVTILLVIIVVIVFTAIYFQNGLHHAHNPPTQLDQTSYSQEAVNISQLRNNITILYETLISMKSAITTLAADLITLRISVANLGSKTNTTFRSLEHKVEETNTTLTALQSKQRRQPG